MGSKPTRICTPPLRVGPPLGFLPRGGANCSCSELTDEGFGARICTCLFWSFGASRAGRCEFGRVWSPLNRCFSHLLYTSVSRLAPHRRRKFFVNFGFAPVISCTLAFPYVLMAFSGSLFSPRASKCTPGMNEHRGKLVDFDFCTTHSGMDL